VQELTVFYIPGLALFNIFRRYVLQLAGQGKIMEIGGVIAFLETGSFLSIAWK